MIDKQRATRVMKLEEDGAPISPYRAMSLFSDQPYLALLESLGAPSKLSRYSFLCVDPFYVVRSKRTECFAGPPGDLRRVERDGFRELSSLLVRFGGKPVAWDPDLPPFPGGAVGYFGYEMLYLVEDIPDVGLDDPQLPDAYFVFYHTILATDRVRRRSWIITNGWGDTNVEALAQADEKAASTRRLLDSLIDPPPESLGRLRTKRNEIFASRPRLAESHLAERMIKPVVTRDQYLGIVQAAKEHIRAGNIFEVCTTQRFDTTLEGDGARLYGILRTVNEPPFAAFLKFPELEVISASPERFLSLDRERWAETRPIKGTRPRGATPADDRKQIEDLSTCEKDQAENIMIVDLARNDLGRVCSFGTVSVPELRIVETYPTTHQLVSTVRGRLRHDVDPMDLIRASFPGGSMTGAPKVEAMKIIDSLEPVKRGVFSGSIGYLSFDGAFDLNIVIRTFVKSGNRVTFHVGGAIVSDSDPADEYQETLDKAHGLVTALELFRSGMTGDEP